MAVEVQAVWHSARLFTRGAAAEWCKEHNFITDVYREKRTDDGETTHHIHRQIDPEDPRIVEGSWATLADDFPPGVSVTTVERKEQNAMKMIHKTGTQSAESPFEFILSDESVDRVGDVIEAKGWDLEQFKRNPIALFAHNHDKPVGVWENIRVVGKELRARLKLAAEGTSAEIDTLRKLVEQRILRAVSVGFQPLEGVPIKETGGYRYTKSTLHEGSLVAVPCNANALAVAKSAGCTPDDLAKLFPDSRPEGQNAAPAIHGHGTGVQKGTASGRTSRNQPQTSNQRKKPIMDITIRIAASRTTGCYQVPTGRCSPCLLEDDDYELTHQDRAQLKSWPTKKSPSGEVAPKPAEAGAGTGICSSSPGRLHGLLAALLRVRPPRKSKAARCSPSTLLPSCMPRNTVSRCAKWSRRFHGNDDEVIATRR